MKIFFHFQSSLLYVSHITVFITLIEQNDAFSYYSDAVIDIYLCILQNISNQNEGSFTGYYYPAWAKPAERISHFLPVSFEIKRL